jgi:hypothetical protein
MNLQQIKQTALDALFYVQLCDNTWDEAQRTRKELEDIINTIFEQLQANTTTVAELIIIYKALVLESSEYPFIQAYFIGLVDGMEMAQRRLLPVDKENDNAK